VHGLRAHLTSLFNTYVISSKSASTNSNARKDQSEEVSSGSSLIDLPQVVIVNLIDKHGGQGNLGRWFSVALQCLSRKVWVANTVSGEDELPVRILRESKYNNRKETAIDDLKWDVPTASGGEGGRLLLRHIWFDYHKKCKSKIEVIKELFPLLFFNQVGTTSYFSSGKKSSILHMQRRVIRTNCMDCLDRTNVVQTIISRWVLIEQLKQLGVAMSCPSDSLHLVNNVILPMFTALVHCIITCCFYY
jgi:SacI homology domain